jgi:hypothetical protein
MPGPIGKRSDQLIRRNIPEVPVDKITAIGKVSIPELGIEGAHPLVSDLYDSLKESAQNKYYEPSDWQMARLALYALNEELTATYQSGDSRPISPMKLQVINQMFSQLMMTEGERRRARLEIDRVSNPSGDEGKVVSISDMFKHRLGAQ